MSLRTAKQIFGNVTTTSGGWKMQQKGVSGRSGQNKKLLEFITIQV